MFPVLFAKLFIYMFVLCNSFVYLLHLCILFMIFILLLYFINLGARCIKPLCCTHRITLYFTNFYFALCIHFTNLQDGSLLRRFTTSEFWEAYDWKSQWSKQYLFDWKQIDVDQLQSRSAFLMEAAVARVSYQQGPFGMHKYGWRSFQLSTSLPLD